ncbi:hypothetical protein B0G38_003508 [Arthrobacter sp. VKM Ac-2550]|nr:hypothetical protein [Arthrobacter sp. VKM Ac-2550]
MVPASSRPSGSIRSSTPASAAGARSSQPSGRPGTSGSTAALASTWPASSAASSAASSNGSERRPPKARFSSAQASSRTLCSMISSSELPAKPSARRPRSRSGAGAGMKSNWKSSIHPPYEPPMTVCDRAHTAGRKHAKNLPAWGSIMRMTSRHRRHCHTAAEAVGQAPRPGRFQYNLEVSGHERGGAQVLCDVCALLRCVWPTKYHL